MIIIYELLHSPFTSVSLLGPDNRLACGDLVLAVLTGDFGHCLECYPKVQLSLAYHSMQKVLGVLQDCICVCSVSRNVEYLQDTASHSEMNSYSHSALKTCAYDVLLFNIVHRQGWSRQVVKLLTAAHVERAYSELPGSPNPSAYSTGYAVWGLKCNIALDAWSS